jgi:hypothetical protein
MIDVRSLSSLFLFGDLALLYLLDPLHLLDEELLAIRQHFSHHLQVAHLVSIKGNGMRFFRYLAWTSCNQRGRGVSAYLPSFSAQSSILLTSKFHSRKFVYLIETSDDEDLRFLLLSMVFICC